MSFIGNIKSFLHLNKCTLHKHKKLGIGLLEDSCVDDCCSECCAKKKNLFEIRHKMDRDAYDRKIRQTQKIAREVLKEKGI